MQESEVQRLKAAEMANQRLQGQLEAAASEQKDLQHRHELVLMDKAYLSKQVEGVQDRLQKVEAELEAQQVKVTELKRERQELHQKLYEAGASRHDQVLKESLVFGVRYNFARVIMTFLRMPSVSTNTVGVLPFG
jgi:predicted transcriptional regulator